MACLKDEMFYVVCKEGGFYTCNFKRLLLLCYGLKDVKDKDVFTTREEAEAKLKEQKDDR